MEIGGRKKKDGEGSEVKEKKEGRKKDGSSKEKRRMRKSKNVRSIKTSKDWI